MSEVSIRIVPARVYIWSRRTADPHKEGLLDYCCCCCSPYSMKKTFLKSHSGGKGETMELSNRIGMSLGRCGPVLTAKIVGTFGG